ncbi:hypothetical protein Cni_G08785 [Canna indica]|uniref:DUF4283 domain-containing protein n=1 Tax=Canna indica TaxID=4628 RepID=A0AAQ3K1J7_9LILI|nr:hypothetical protein Cni_G08785 [Canna indica]
MAGKHALKDSGDWGDPDFTFSPSNPPRPKKSSDPGSSSMQPTRSAFKETNLVDNLPNRDDVTEKIDRIKRNSTDEVFVDEGLIQLSRSNWVNSLYGKFYGRTPPLSLVQNIRPKVWKVSCAVQVVDLAFGFFCFKFANADDLEKVLSNGPWFLRGQVLLLIPWRENFQPMLERIETIPVWVQFSGLPIEFLHGQILTKLASVIGQPLKVDHITLKGNRAKFARVCILWNLNKTVPNDFWINASSKRFWQAIALENILKLYFKCGKIGHLEEHYASIHDSPIYVPLDNTSTGNGMNLNLNKENVTPTYKDLHGRWQIVNKRRNMLKKYANEKGNSMQNIFEILPNNDDRKEFDDCNDM